MNKIAATVDNFGRSILDNIEEMGRIIILFFSVLMEVIFLVSSINTF